MASESLPSDHFANGDRGGTFIAAAASMIALGTLALVLRLVSRLSSEKAGIWWDDGLAIVAWVFLMPDAGLTIYLKSLGMGQHIGHVSQIDISQIEKVIYVGKIFYTLSLTFSKLSALAFFTRVFTWSQVWFKASTLTVGVFCISWCIAITFVNCFECDPIYKVWKPQTSGRCLSAHSIYLGTSIPNVVIDFLILVLPLPLLSSLHASRTQRAFLIGIFMLGYCVLALSLARLIIILRATDAQLEDLTYTFVSNIILAILEPGIALISVCIPAHFYLAKRIGKYISKMSILGSVSSLPRKGRNGAHPEHCRRTPRPRA